VCRQRLTTSASLYGYCHSVGLDDCYLGDHPSAVARRIVSLSADALMATVAREDASSTERIPPYCLEESEQMVGRLIGVRAESEGFVVDCALRPRRRRTIRKVLGSAMMETNAIAVLSMLGTKGSVSNLVQCTHALGHPGTARGRQSDRSRAEQIIHDTRLPRSDFGRVFPHDAKFVDDPVARGLLHQESFIEGLKPQAFFIRPGRVWERQAIPSPRVHAIAGREALVEGATSTAQASVIVFF